MHRARVLLQKNPSIAESSFMPFGLNKLFAKRAAAAPSISAMSHRTSSTHWNEKSRTYETKVTLPSTAEELAGSAELQALAIFHSVANTSDVQRTAGWLGEDEPERQKILVEFLRLFNWNGQCIVEAFRTLCTRVQMKGESQHLDRVVDAFAKRWIECNPHHAFVSQGVVYTVTYSILLLNTDLHTKVDTNKSNMTQKQYVKYVTESLNRLFSNERPTFAKVTDYGAFLESERPSITSFVVDDRKYARSEWFACISGILRLFYRSIAHTPLVIPDGLVLTRKQTTDTEAGSSRRMMRRSSISTFGSLAPSASDLQPEFEGKFGDQEGLDKLRLLGPPWAKEGPLTFQYFHDVESGMKKQHKSEWTDLFAVADRGQLRLYKLRGRMASTAATEHSVGDGNWLGQAQLMHSFTLTNALAQVGDQGENPGEWSLLLAGDKLLRFKTGSSATASEYVYTCNYWAARLSKPPLVEMVSSTEYGWGRPIELVQGRRDLPTISQHGNDSVVIGDERITIYRWKNRHASELHSNLVEGEQLAFLQEYVASIDSELAQHSVVLGDMLRIFTPRLQISSRAHANWEARSQFLLKETVQYTTYCRTLERSLVESKKLSTPEKEEAGITPKVENLSTNDDKDTSAIYHNADEPTTPTANITKIDTVEGEELTTPRTGTETDTVPGPNCPVPPLEKAPSAAH